MRSMADFDSALSKGSDEASERLGMDHKFVKVDAKDAPGVTDVGLESQAKARGLKSKRRIFV